MFRHNVPEITRLMDLDVESATADGTFSDMDHDFPGDNAFQKPTILSVTRRKMVDNKVTVECKDFYGDNVFQKPTILSATRRKMVDNKVTVECTSSGNSSDNDKDFSCDNVFQKPKIHRKMVDNKVTVEFSSSGASNDINIDLSADNVFKKPKIHSSVRRKLVGNKITLEFTSGGRTSSMEHEDYFRDIAFRKRKILSSTTRKVEDNKVPQQITISTTGLEKVGRVRLDSDASTTSIAANLYEKLERNYLKSRKDIISKHEITKDEFIHTPLHVVKSMAESYNTRYHAEVFSITSAGGLHIRVEVFVGNIRGIGQSPQRKLSFQIAAADLLEKMVIMNATKLPPYGLLPGQRINPIIYRTLIKFCGDNGFDYPRYVLVEERPYELAPMYVVECRIGTLSEQAESDSRFMAKRLAAKKMYERLSPSHFPDDVVLMGNECVGLKELKRYGVDAGCSKWKMQWMMENRTGDGELIVESDEPDDGDLLGCDEDFMDFETEADPRTT